MKEGNIPDGMDNNYYIFDIEKMIKVRKADFSMSKRRRWCDDCTPVKEILLEMLVGGANDIVIGTNRVNKTHFFYVFVKELWHSIIAK